MQIFLQQLINGLSLGAVYALIAVGYTMVYGILQLINFAHGEVFMIGAMASLYAASWLGLVGLSGFAGFFGLLAVLLIAIVVCGALGFTIEFLAYRPLRNQTRLTALITAIGVSLFLQYGGQRVFGATPKPFPTIWPGLTNGTFLVGRVVVNAVDLVVIGLTLFLMLALTWIVLRTKAGLALRAVSYNFDTASLMGVNINRIISFTFVLGSSLAAAGGLLYAVKYPSVNPLMGLFPGLKAFVAAVLGGIGNIAGAVTGALLLGLVEVLVIGYVPNGSQYRDAVAFVILIAILLVKPSGLFGKTAVEKV
jgi:branched-chain amino acid transport system permease protein